MRWLITGGCGFIGSHLVRRAVRDGHDVLNVDCLTYAGRPESVADVADEPNYAFAKIDLVDAPEVDAAVADFRPDAVLHLAAESHVDRSIEDPTRFLRTNVLGTDHLLRAALNLYQSTTDEAFRFVHVSTDEVYGTLGCDGVFTESTPYAPRSPYSASKAAADHLVAAYHATYGLPTVITHGSNAFGPNQYPEKLIPVVIDRCLTGRGVPVFGDGTQVREWTAVSDHVEGILAALRHGRPGETYNLGGGTERTNIDLVRRICHHLDTLRPRPDGRPHADAIRHVTDRPGHDFRYAMSGEKAAEELGWRPRADFDASLADTVRWYVENPRSLVPEGG